MLGVAFAGKASRFQRNKPENEKSGLGEKFSCTSLFTFFQKIVSLVFFRENGKLGFAVSTLFERKL